MDCPSIQRATTTARDQSGHRSIWDTAAKTVSTGRPTSMLVSIRIVDCTALGSPKLVLGSSIAWSVIPQTLSRLSSPRDTQAARDGLMLPDYPTAGSYVAATVR